LDLSLLRRFYLTFGGYSHSTRRLLTVPISAAFALASTHNTKHFTQI
jgi:hypothetical protein